MLFKDGDELTLQSTEINDWNSPPGDTTQVEGWSLQIEACCNGWAPPSSNRDDGKDFCNGITTDIIYSDPILGESDSVRHWHGEGSKMVVESGTCAPNRYILHENVNLAHFVKVDCGEGTPRVSGEPKFQVSFGRPFFFVF